MDSWGCAWQTQPAEKEFKGIVLAAGEESREGRGEQTARKEEEMTYSVFHFTSRYNTLEFVTSHLQETAHKQLFLHCMYCTLIFLAVIIISSSVLFPGED